MLTEQEYIFSTNSMGSVSATLFWREVAAEVDLESGRITQAEYDKVKRLLDKSEREWDRRRKLPYLCKFHKGEFVFGA